MNGWIRTLAAGALVAAFACGEANAQQVVAKYSTPTINEIVHWGMKLYKARVESRVGKDLRIDIYPASQLGAIPRVVEGVQLGTIEMATLPPEFMVGLDSRFGVLSAPALFDNVMHGYWTTHDPEFKKEYWALGQNKGIHLFRIECTVQAVIVMKKAFAGLDDFKGMKVRSFPSPMERETFKRLGATVAPMPLDEMVPGLQQGVIDGAKSGAGVFTSFKVYNIAKTMVRLNDTLVCPVHFANKAWFDKLPAAVRAAIEEEGLATDLANNWRAYEDDQVQGLVWKQNGGTEVSLTPEQRADMEKRLATVAEDVTANDPGARKMFELMKRAAERTKNAAVSVR
jgi:TRAP-type C4-dicarboxylate transport system substrate-binding protein